MKKYRLWEHYENYGLIGEYDTEEEAREAAEEHAEDTDGECQIVLYSPLQRVLRLLHTEKGYEVII